MRIKMSKNKNSLFTGIRVFKILRLLAVKRYCGVLLFCLMPFFQACQSIPTTNEEIQWISFGLIPDKEMRMIANISYAQTYKLNGDVDVIEEHGNSEYPLYDSYSLNLKSKVKTGPVLPDGSYSIVETLEQLLYVTNGDENNFRKFRTDMLNQLEGLAFEGAVSSNTGSVEFDTIGGHKTGPNVYYGPLHVNSLLNRGFRTNVVRVEDRIEITRLSTVTRLREGFRYKLIYRLQKIEGDDAYYTLDPDMVFPKMPWHRRIKGSASGNLIYNNRLNILEFESNRFEIDYVSTDFDPRITFHIKSKANIRIKLLEG